MGDLASSHAVETLREHARQITAFRYFTKSLPNLDPSVQILLFLRSRINTNDISLRTAAKYSSVLGSILPRLGTPVDSMLLSQWRKGILSLDSPDEEHAVPMTSHFFVQLCQRYPQYAAQFQLFRLLAARWSDLTRLTWSRITVDGEYWTVNLDGITKMTRIVSHRADHYVRIKPTPMMRTWMGNKGHSERVISMSQHEYLQCLQSIPTLDKERKFSLHSLKQGAITDLGTILATTAAPAEAGTLLSRVARHVNAQPSVPRDTVRYTATKSTIGILNNTAEYTKLLTL